MTSAQKKMGLVLIVQVALILLFQSPLRGTSTRATATTLFPELDAETVSRVRLSDAEEDVVLTREDGRWSLEEHGGFPADQQKVDELIRDLAGLEVRRPIVRSSKYHSAFKVKDNEHEGRVRVWSDPGGKPVADLIVGNSGSYRASRVRRSGDSEVYEVSGLAAYDVRPNAGSWARSKLVEAAADAVKGVSIINSGGSLQLARNESGWTAGETTLDSSKVDALVRTLTNLSITAPLGPSSEHGPTADDAVASATLEWSETIDGAEIDRRTVILIGDKRPDDDTRRSITVKGSGFSGEIWDSTVKQLIEKSLDDLALQNDS